MCIHCLTMDWNGSINNERGLFVIHARMTVNLGILWGFPSSFFHHARMRLTVLLKGPFADKWDYLANKKIKKAKGTNNSRSYGHAHAERKLILDRNFHGSNAFYVGVSYTQLMMWREEILTGYGAYGWKEDEADPFFPDSHGNFIHGFNEPINGDRDSLRGTISEVEYSTREWIITPVTTISRNRVKNQLNCGAFLGISGVGLSRGTEHFCSASWSQGEKAVLSPEKPLLLKLDPRDMGYPPSQLPKWITDILGGRRISFSKGLSDLLYIVWSEVADDDMVHGRRRGLKIGVSSGDISVWLRVRFIGIAWWLAFRWGRWWRMVAECLLLFWLYSSL